MPDKTTNPDVLLPCPFCGAEAHIDGNEESHYFAGCNECYCNVGEAYDRSAMPEHMFMSAEEAIAAWNRRSSLSEKGNDTAALRARAALEEKGG